MSDAGSWTALRVAALVAASLVAGAALAGWRAASRRAVSTHAAAREDDAAFAAPAVQARAPGLAARLAERLARPPQPLADSLFTDDGEPGQAAFADIASPLASPRTQVLALGRADGSWLRDRAHGWFTFRGQHWVPVPRASVPPDVVRRWPDPDPRALRREPASRDGDVEAP